MEVRTDGILQMDFRPTLLRLKHPAEPQRTDADQRNHGLPAKLLENHPDIPSPPDDWASMMQTNTSYKVSMIKTLTEGATVVKLK